ncbi:MAG: acetyl-CoA carboxylase biotin carboxyl carrier protein [Chitinispirillaceae bacterium]
MTKGNRQENALHKVPLRITDTTLRDAHQSLWATRMRTDDILGIIDEIDNAGFYSLEVWGGATFDVCLRFLRENPWHRLRAIKARCKNTPLQMLLRGQNLVGYRNYADDVVDRFVALACENGIDIFRVFDALNDTRNLEAAIKAVKKYGGHAQGTLAYTISPVHTVEKYVEYAKEQVALGIDSLCIKDMAGILSPIMAEKLVSALVKKVDVPIQLHCHSTSGMATATYVEGVRAGAGAIDCAISPMAGYSAQPPVETLAAIFEETNYSPHLNFEALSKIAGYFAKLSPKREIKSTRASVIDPDILIHQIPGGMISNFHSQLSIQNALDKLPEALEEVTKVREDMGWPPLVTPTSQIVGTQAVMNVLSGERYAIVPNEVKDYIRGRYGRSPVPIAPEFIRKILGDEKPIDHRPADEIKPMLPDATKGLEADLVENEEDIVSYILLPESAVEYFKWRRLPEDQRSEIPADVELRKMQETENLPAGESEVAKSAAPAQPNGEIAPMVHPDDYQGISKLLQSASGLKIDSLNIKKKDFSITVRARGARGPVSEQEEQPLSEAASVPEVEDTEAPPQSPGQRKSESVAREAEYEHVIKAPLVGTFYAASGPGKPPFVKVGDQVKKGDKICIVEAMKLFNEIVAPKDGKIVAVMVDDGQSVEKGQPLVAYDPS